MESSKYASIGKRSTAFLIDDIAVSFILALIAFDELKMVTDVATLNIVIKKYALIAVLIKIIYHTFFIGLYGKTLGKHFTKITVADENTLQPIGYPKALLRALGRVMSEFSFFIGFLVALFNNKRQTFHDFISNSVVLEDEE